MRRILYRNVRAGDYLELFLVSAVTSLLALRFFLYLAGYPQVGGGSLHIAHMLYGGLLMMAAIVLLVSFLGARVQRLAAFLGGVGFGIFIDELGKFITKDNNYFFKPTIGIIYAIFILVYLASSFLTRRSNFSSREYQLNALNQFEEAVVYDLDPVEQQRIARLLDQADPASLVTRELRRLLHSIETVSPPAPNRLRVLLDKLGQQYQRFWKLRASNRIVAFIFVAEATVFLAAVFLSLADNFGDIGQLFKGQANYSQALITGQLLATLAASYFALRGGWLLPTSRLAAFEQFRRASLVTLLLTEFFLFSRIQFGAMPSFAANLIILLGLRYAILQELQLQKGQD